MHIHPQYITTRSAAQKAGKAVPSYGAGPGGSGLTPSQSSSIYGANKLYSLGSRGQGKGATLAVFELSGYTSSDVTTYEHQFFGASENVPLVDINVDGGPLTPVCPKGDKCNPPNDYSGDIEVVADIETQIAIAPQIDGILVYNAPNDFQGITILDEYLKIAHDNLADSISSSWGACEQDTGFAAAQAESVAFKQMATQGQSMFSAAGDTGAYDCLRGSGLTKLTVDDPSSQPYVTAVGGTSFGTFDPRTSLHPSYPTGFETVWNVLNLCNGTASGLKNCANFGAGGGGAGAAGGEERVDAESIVAVAGVAGIAAGVFGAERIGAVSAAVNGASKGDFLSHALRLSQAAVVVTDNLLRFFKDECKAFSIRFQTPSSTGFVRANFCTASRHSWRYCSSLSSDRE